MEEVTDILRVDEATIRRWAKLKRIKVVRLPQTTPGGHTVIRLAQRTLDKRREES